MSRHRIILSLVAAFASVVIGRAGAQSTGVTSATSQSDQSALQEIIVTAERRSTSLQQTALAVTAVGGDSLQQRNINSVQDLASSIPTLDLGVSLGQAHPAIRGIGASDIIFGADPRVALYVDDVYLARPEELLGTMFDVEQVQVLNGPQGTLYGRNATGGALLISSRKPTSTPSGYVDLTYGNYGDIESSGALSGGLSETLSARVAFQTIDHSGYGRNLITGNDVDNAHERSARLSFLWHPMDGFSFLLQMDYHNEHDNDYAEYYGGLANLSKPPVQPTGLGLGGFIPPAGSRNVANLVDPINDRVIWGTTGTATWQVGDVTLKSITGFRHANLTNGSSIDPSSLDLARLNELQVSRQLSQELQALSDVGNNHWIAGLAYFHEHLVGQDPVGLNLQIFGGPDFFAQGVNQAGDVTTKSIALYGRDSYDFTDRLTATLGGRYTYEKKNIFNQFGFDLVSPYSISNPIANSLPFPYYDEKTYNAFTPSAGLEYKFTPDVFGYATITEGYKSGGFNIGVYQPAFKPEKIWDYEVGLKNTLFDKRLQMNIAAFYYDYSNLQVSIVEGTQAIIQNAAKAVIYGGEFQLTALPIQNVQLDFALAALHSEYKDYLTTDPANPQSGTENLTGNQLTQAPKLKVNVGAQYTWNLPNAHLSLRGEYTWVDDIYFTPFDTPNAWSPSHSLTNLFLNYEAQNWTAKAFVRNLTDKTIVAQAYNATSLVGLPVNVALDPPRTYGVSLGYKF
jgi:iron complex outermembrane receptor protein